MLLKEYNLVLSLVHFGLIFPRRSSISLPLNLEVPHGYLGSLSHSESSLIQTQLAHVQIIFSRYQQQGRPAGMQLHLARNVLTIEVSIPETYKARVNSYSGQMYDARAVPAAILHRKIQTNVEA